MNGDELIAVVREHTKDDVTPYLKSDEVILAHLQEAERIMCRETHVLIDTQVELYTEADKATYVLDPEILRVYAARVATDNLRLSRLRGAAHGFHIGATTGKPTHFSSNLGDKQFTTYPVSDQAYQLEMICAILPYVPVDADSDSELPEEHHRVLADYAAHKCLMTPDEDAENLEVSMYHWDTWTAYVRNLKREIYRYRTGDRLVLANWTGTRNG